MPSGGCAYSLAFVNEGTTDRRISYHLENLSPLPQGLTMAVWNGDKGAFEDLAASKGDTVVAIGAGATQYRTLLVGNSGYLAKARQQARPSLLALVGTYPNPFRAAVRIRYSIPYDGVKSVKFVIYSLSGRVLWRSEVKDVTHAGGRDLAWNGIGANGKPVAAGVYVLRMTALNSGTKLVGVFERKMTLLP
jgi:hypothetical protein